MATISDEDLERMAAHGSRLRVEDDHSLAAVPLDVVMPPPASEPGGPVFESATLGWLTDDTYLRYPGLTEPPPPGCDIAPVKVVENRLVWLLVFDRVPAISSGRVSRDRDRPQTPRPRPLGRMYYAYDARTGQMVLGRTIGPSRS